MPNYFLVFNNKSFREFCFRDLGSLISDKSYVGYGEDRPYIRIEIVNGRLQIGHAAAAGDGFNGHLRHDSVVIDVRLPNGAWNDNYNLMKKALVDAGFIDSPDFKPKHRLPPNKVTPLPLP